MNDYGDREMHGVYCNEMGLFIIIALTTAVIIVIAGILF